MNVVLSHICENVTILNHKVLGPMCIFLGYWFQREALHLKGELYNSILNLVFSLIFLFLLTEQWGFTFSRAQWCQP